MRFLLLRSLMLSLLLALGAFSALAQDEKAVQLEVYAATFVVTNNGTIVAAPFRKDNIGLGGGGAIKFYDFIAFHADVYGDHTNNAGGPARTKLRANASVSPWRNEFIRLWAGVEGFKVGNETGAAGFGALTLLDFIILSGAYGQDDYTVADGEARLVRLKNVDFGVFYRLHKMTVGGAQDRGQIAGFRLYLKPGK